VPLPSDAIEPRRGLPDGGPPQVMLCPRQTGVGLPQHPAYICSENVDKRLVVGTSPVPVLCLIVIGGLACSGHRSTSSWPGIRCAKVMIYFKIEWLSCSVCSLHGSTLKYYR
jgi:hypothetical protein